MSDRRMTDDDYRRLYEFRARLRRFQRGSDERIVEAGLTPAQYLVLLGIRGHPGNLGPTIRDIAEFMQLKHHSAVGLVNRVEAANLIRRKADTQDGRAVRLALTAKGRAKLERLAEVNQRDLVGLGLINRALQAAPTDDSA